MPTVPENAKQPQDRRPKTATDHIREALDAEAAREAEANGVVTGVVETPAPAELAEPEAEVEVEKPVVTQTDGSFTVEYKGFKAVVGPDALNDFELLDDLVSMDEADGYTRLPGVMKRLFGKERFKEALATLRDPETGRVSVAAADWFLGEVLSGLNPTSAS